MKQISECTVCFLKFKPLTQGDCICEIRRVIIEIDGHVYKVRYKCPRGFFGYGMVDGKVQETD